MRQKLESLSHKLFFTINDLSAALGIKRQSAWVLCNRNVQSGRLIRLKNNFYVLKENWQTLTREKFFELANFLQVPSYISFLTALSYYEVTTQITKDFYENASIKRTVNYNVEPAEFKYYKLKKDYYFSYEKKGKFFIASREKALVDAVYLYSFGKYRLDFNALDMRKFDLKAIKRIIKVYPEKTRKIMEKLWKN